MCTRVCTVDFAHIHRAFLRPLKLDPSNKNLPPSLSIKLLTPCTMHNVSSNHNPISAEKPPPRSPWAASVNSNPTCVQTFPLEIFVTDDLPNGPYGEITPARGELHVMPGADYETVAVVLDATWMKYCKRDLNKYSTTYSRKDRRERDMATLNVPNYRVIFIEFKGGICAPEQKVAPGSHTCSVGRVLTLRPPSEGCCIIA
jgi:hypothetical protein